MPTDMIKDELSHGECLDHAKDAIQLYKKSVVAVNNAEITKNFTARFIDHLCKKCKKWEGCVDVDGDVVDDDCDEGCIHEL